MRDPNLIRDIVDLEDELHCTPYEQFKQDWVQDRVKELRFFYELLLKEWPILPNRGSPRDDPDERTYHADTE